MTIDDNDNNSIDAINATHEAVMVERGTARFYRRLEKTSLDQTKAGIEVISMNVDLVEQELQNQLRMRKDSKGGPKAFWENWLYFCDLNWNQDSVDSKGEPIWNAPEDTNLWAVADFACRVAMECYGRRDTLAKTSMRLGKHFHAHTFGVVLERSSDGRRISTQISRATQKDSRDNERRVDRAMRLLALKGHTDEAWGENQLLQCGNVLWNAVCLGGGIFMHRKLPMGDEFYPDSYKQQEAYYPVLRPEVEQYMTERNAHLATLEPMLGPMPQQPLPWAGDNFGPYRDNSLAKLVPFVRNTGEAQANAINAARRNDQLKFVEQAVDVLAKVPYEINRYVLQAFRWVKNDEKRADSVNGFPHIEYTKPERMKDKEFAKLTKREKRDVRLELKGIEADNLLRLGNIERLKQWDLSAELQTNPAHNPTGRFFMPHNCDSRGRVYHVGDFGHHNTDCLRAMFNFHRKKAVGPSGGLVLALSLANNYGVDKVTLDKRLEWAAKMEELILLAGRSFAADKTKYDVWNYDDDNNFVLVGQQTPFEFWRTADKPFQFLAACHELVQLRDFEERNPGMGAEYPSGLPISLDATNSGMQHYAAACLNYDDGLLTNLVPQDGLNDLYLKCWERAVELFRAKLATDKASLDADPVTAEEQQEIDAFHAIEDDESVSWDDLQAAREAFNDTAAGLKYKLARHVDAVERLLAWDGYILPKNGRKVMKRNAMTFAYSSRRHGFADQIRTDTMLPLSRAVRKNKLKEHPFGRDHGFMASHIMAGIHEQAIMDTVESAKSAMEYLQSCAKALTEDGKHFQFTSRYGFPMYQNYKVKAKRSNQPPTWLFDFELMEYDRASESLALRRFTDQIEARESRQAISPNVIHTQDAAMLQGAVMLCEQENIHDLMVVHDSFATTIADAQTMSGLLRLALVDLYDDYDLWAVIDEQVRSMIENPANLVFIKPYPDRSKGKLKLEEVMKSDYAFS